MNRDKKIKARRGILKFTFWLLLCALVVLASHYLWYVWLPAILFLFLLFEELWTNGSKRLEKFFEVEKVK